MEVTSNDVCRLMYLYVYGGYYMDIDQQLFKPFVEFIRADTVF